MIWKVAWGDILDCKADALVVSANPQLNLSGGVGAALRMRYGDELQQQLHDHLQQRNEPVLKAGEILVTQPAHCEFKTIIHAVGIDVFYDTQSSIIATAVLESLHAAEQLQMSSMAMAAIGTGYGRLPMAPFAEAILSVDCSPFTSLKSVTICLRNEAKARELSGILAVPLDSI